MYKSILFLFTLLACVTMSLAFSFKAYGFGHESKNLETQELQHLSEPELTISTGPREGSSSSLITKSESQFFCNSANLTVQINSRLDEYKTETFKSFDISAFYNGSKIDLPPKKGTPNLDNFYHIVPDMICRKKQIYMFLTGYNGGSENDGTTVMEIKIDTRSGKIQ